MTSRAKKLLWIAGALVAVLALGTVLWVRRFHRYTPIEVVLDVKAGMAARNAPHPVERFLELRYGPLTEPANRQKAFLDFFNVGHIEGLQLLVSHAPPEHRQASIDAMAQWLAAYRLTMSPEEKSALRERLISGDGRNMLRHATAQYLSQDVRYRGATAKVIEELMATVAAVQNDQ